MGNKPILFSWWRMERKIIKPVYSKAAQHIGYCCHAATPTWHFSFTDSANGYANRLRGPTVCRSHCLLPFYAVKRLVNNVHFSSPKFYLVIQMCNVIGYCLFNRTQDRPLISLSFFYYFYNFLSLHHSPTHLWCNQRWWGIDTTVEE